MTDNNQWQSPSGVGPPTGGADAPLGAQAGFGQPQQPGWTPPPKPGLIPLRPMTLGTILAASFQVMRRNPRPTFGLSLTISGIVGLVAVGVLGVVVYFALDRVLAASEGDLGDITAGGVALSALAGLFGLGVGVVGTAILQGIISLEVARGTVGEKLSLRGLWIMAKGRIGALIGWSLLASAAVVIAITIAVTLIVLVAVAASGVAGIVIAVLLGILAGLGLVALSFWIGTRLAFVPSSIVLERLPIFRSVRRSWSLTIGYFWRTLGIILLVSVIVSVAAQIITTPVGIVMGLVLALWAPTGDPGVIANLTFLTNAVSIIITAVITAITSIITSATAALLYIDLRMRKEGLDLQLIRFVEARGTGTTNPPDPYLAAADASTAPNPDPGSPWA